LHPTLHTWREEASAAAVRLLAYVGGAVVLSILAAHLFRTPAPPLSHAAAPSDPWNDIERPFPAFALSIPEAAESPARYVIRRNVIGGGRKDILTLGNPDTSAPYLAVEIYRPGTEISRFLKPASTIAAGAAALRPTGVRTEQPLASKFGLLDIVTFKTTKAPVRKCLGFVRTYDDPRLQLSGWFCRGGEFVQRSTLACALDRLTLLSSGREPKVGELFAKAELNRHFCGERNPILAATPKYRLLWKALADRSEPRRRR
jgi:hypothetical protein